VALKALDDVKKWGGVRDVAITTFQSLSGRGDAKYPRELVMGNVYPLKGTVERTGEYQKGELKRLMPGVERVSVGAYRVPVQKGHLVDVRVRFKGRSAWVPRDDDSQDDVGGPLGERLCEGERERKPTAAEIKAAFESFDPLRDAPLPSKPARAIFVKPLDEPFVSSAGPASLGASARLTPAPPRLGTPRPKDDCEFENGMAICVGNIDVEDDCFDVAFCVVVNNVARGAWGAAMLNAEYWSYLRNRKP
jgi:aspartate-semialdehyde dehydrogenase